MPAALANPVASHPATDHCQVAAHSRGVGELRTGDRGSAGEGRDRDPVADSDVAFGVQVAVDPTDRANRGCADRGPCRDPLARRRRRCGAVAR